MKKLIFTAAIFAALGAQAQEIKTDTEGNFYEVPKTVQAHDSTTAKTYTDAEGKTEPVFIGKRGSYYIGVISRSGNYYRKYLTPTKGKTEEK